LQARGVSFAYAVPVVRNFSAALLPGTVTGIIGPNGSGKTTVLRLLDGLLHPLEGEVLLDGGTPLCRLSRRLVAKHIAMVPQNALTASFHTVFECAMQGRSPHLHFLAFETAQDEQIVREVLEMTDLARLAEARASELSGGERQRLFLARALAQQTRVLLLDEFTANLDINYQVELMRLVRRLTRERGLATAVVSHEINLLAAFSDEVILMQDGSVRHQGPVAKVVTRDNLKRLFGLDFLVRPLPSGVPEVQPIMDDMQR
ncbi:MAG: ABC transporter ATP-binding protein, partial [Acidobacteria bacterium]|nr:ABC transporter ATP-binding protein [Acidobacteriota bacterium]